MLAMMVHVCVSPILRTRCLSVSHSALSHCWLSPGNALPISQVLITLLLINRCTYVVSRNLRIARARDTKKESKTEGSNYCVVKWELVASAEYKYNKIQVPCRSSCGIPSEGFCLCCCYNNGEGGDDSPFCLFILFNLNTVRRSPGTIVNWPGRGSKYLL